MDPGPARARAEPVPMIRPVPVPCQKSFSPLRHSLRARTNGTSDGNHGNMARLEASMETSALLILDAMDLSLTRDRRDILFLDCFLHHLCVWRRTGGSVMNANHFGGGESEGQGQPRVEGIARARDPTVNGIQSKGKTNAATSE